MQGIQSEGKPGKHIYIPVALYLIYELCIGQTTKTQHSLPEFTCRNTGLTLEIELPAVLVVFHWAQVLALRTAILYIYIYTICKATTQKNRNEDTVCQKQESMDRLIDQGPATRNLIHVPWQAILLVHADVLGQAHAGIGLVTLPDHSIKHYKKKKETTTLIKCLWSIRGLTAKNLAETTT